MSIQQVSKTTLFADDTSVMIIDKDQDIFRQKINQALTNMNLWFQTNQLVLNIQKTHIIKFSPTITVHASLDVYYNNTLINEAKSSKFLGFQVDSQLNWKYHVEQILPKLNASCFTIRSLTYILNQETLGMIYHVYFHSILQYGVIFGGNSPHVHQVFKIQKEWLG